MGTKLDSKSGSESRISDHYSVKTICQLTGLNEHTLRAWERRYQIVTPQRLDNGRRVYSLDDLEKLKLVTLLVRKGFLIGNIANSSIIELSALVNDSQAIPDEDAAQNDKTTEYKSQIKAALGEYDLLTVHSLIQRVRIELGLRSFIFDVVISLIRDVGAAIDAGEFGIGHEHALSSIIRAELTQLLYVFTQTYIHPIHNKRQESAKIFAIATNEGNSHEFGALISAVICALHGFPVYYFGSNMPAHSLAESAKAVGANSIVLGLPTVSLMPPQVIDSYVRDLKSDISSICQIWVGGQLTEAIENDKTIRKISSLIELDTLLASIKAI